MYNLFHKTVHGNEFFIMKTRQISVVLTLYILFRLHRKLKEIVDGFSKARMLVFCCLAWWKKPDYSEELGSNRPGTGDHYSAKVDKT